MTVRTKAQLDEIFKDDQPAESITASDVRDLVDSAPFLQEEVFGWEFLYGGPYTSSSPLVVPQGDVGQIKIDGSIENSRYPSGFAGAWDTTNNKLLPALLNGFGIIRVAFTAFSDTNNNRFEFFMDVGALGSPVTGSPQGAKNVVYQETREFVKGTGIANAQNFNFVIPLFVGPDFATNGGFFFVQPTEGSAEFYDFAITATRTFAPNPAA